MTPSRQQPILVTGMPRSGTTWVARMLLASGRLGLLNEPFNLAKDPGTVRVPVARWFEYVSGENEDEILPALSPLLAFRYPLARELWTCRDRTHLHHTARSWWGYRRSGNRRPLVKEPHAVFSAEWFSRRLGSDVLVMVRHPAAVVSSWKRLGWTFDFANLLEQRPLLRDWLGPYASEMRAALEPSVGLVDRVSLLWDLVYRVVDALDERVPNLHVLRQEDLARSPVERFRAIYDAVGLEFTEDARQAVTASSRIGNPKELDLDTPHSTMLDSAASLENWRHRLTSDEVERIRSRTEETAARYYGDVAW